VKRRTDLHKSKKHRERGVKCGSKISGLKEEKMTTKDIKGGKVLITGDYRAEERL